MTVGVSLPQKLGAAFLRPRAGRRRNCSKWARERKRSRVVTRRRTWARPAPAIQDLLFSRATRIRLSSDSPNNSKDFTRMVRVINGNGNSNEMGLGVCAGHDSTTRSPSNLSVLIWQKYHCNRLFFLHDVQRIPWSDSPRSFGHVLPNRDKFYSSGALPRKIRPSGTISTEHSERRWERFAQGFGMAFLEPLDTARGASGGIDNHQPSYRDNDFGGAEQDAWSSHYTQVSYADVIRRYGLASCIAMFWIFKWGHLDSRAK